MRTLAYLRVSTDHQNIESQRSRIVRWCGYQEVDLLDVDWLEDEAVTGALRIKDAKKRLDYYADFISGLKKHHRSGFLNLLSAINSREYHRIITCEITRLSRDVIELLLLAEIMQSCDCELVSLDAGGETIVLNTASGWFNWVMRCGMAQHERDQTSERTVTSLADKRANGIKLGKPPAGWMRKDRVEDGGGKCFVPDPKQWPTMKKVAALREKGSTFKDIAKQVDGINSKVARTWCLSWERRSEKGFEMTEEQEDLSVEHDRYRLFQGGE